MQNWQRLPVVPRWFLRSSGKRPVLRTLVSALLMPPAVNILAIVVGLLLLRFFKRLSISLMMGGLISLWLLATPLFSSLLHESIERYPAIDAATIALESPQAIVVLGAAHYDRAAEYNHRAAPTAYGLTRLHYAAFLQQQTGLPVMLTGGPMNRDQDIHSVVLERALEVYGIKARWREERSATTWQNALFSAETLLPLGINKVIVVTHSYHMQRAVKLFELAGFTVLPGPTELSTRFPWHHWGYWLPDSKSLALSHSVLHEYLGLLWYHWVNPVKDNSERDIRLPAY